MLFMILTLILFSALNLYVIIRLKSYINTFISGKRFTILYIFLWLLLIAMIVYDGIRGDLFGAVFSIYMAVFIYLFLLILIVDIIRIFARKTDKKKWSAAIFIAAFCVLTYGFINAYVTDIKEYSIETSKELEPLKIVQISDTHYGSLLGLSNARQTVEKINEQNPDIVLYTGDVFDGDYDWVRNPDEIAETLSKINSKYGTYACWGNHDVYGGLTDEMYSFLKKANINLLEDNSVLIDNKFYVIGRLDAQSSLHSDVKTIDELTSGLDKSKYIIVMDHRPKELYTYSSTGTDLVLSGHTHDGQTFPFNLIINCFWENAYGFKQFDNTSSIVTSGVGLWGPPIRVGTESEIAVINVK